MQMLFWIYLLLGIIYIVFFIWKFSFICKKYKYYQGVRRYKDFFMMSPSRKKDIDDCSSIYYWDVSDFDEKPITVCQKGANISRDMKGCFSFIDMDGECLLDNIKFTSVCWSDLWLASIASLIIGIFYILATILYKIVPIESFVFLNTFPIVILHIFMKHPYHRALDFFRFEKAWSNPEVKEPKDILEALHMEWPENCVSMYELNDKPQYKISQIFVDCSLCFVKAIFALVICYIISLYISLPSLVLSIMFVISSLSSFILFLVVLTCLDTFMLDRKDDDMIDYYIEK